MMQTAKSRFLLLVLILGVSGCGLKGPLYLPAEEPAVAADKQENVEAPDDETDDKAKKKDNDIR